MNSLLGTKAVRREQPGHESRSAKIRASGG